MVKHVKSEAHLRPVYSYTRANSRVPPACRTSDARLRGGFRRRLRQL